jgi:hypothetical protein
MPLLHLNALLAALHAINDGRFAEPDYQQREQLGMLP